MLKAPQSSQLCCWVLVHALGINYADEKESKKKNPAINSSRSAAGNSGDTDSTALQNIQRTRLFHGPDVSQSKATRQVRALTTCRFV